MKKAIKISCWWLSVMLIVCMGWLSAEVKASQEEWWSIQYDDEHQFDIKTNKEYPILTDGEYRYILYDDETACLVYGGHEATVTIPVEAGGHPVTAIAGKVDCMIYESGIITYTYRSCLGDGVKEVYIPDGVTEIREGTFYNCANLTVVSMPDSLTEIDAHAFFACTGLTTVEISNSVTKIGKNAFSGCTGLTTVKIPCNVTEIGDCAFFECTGLTMVELPDSVTEIGDCAFSGCTELTAIDIPDSVTEIGWGAFSGCTHLAAVDISDSLMRIASDVFSDCTGLTTVAIPNSVTEIGYSAFSGCTGLTAVKIPESVTEIEWKAFYGCTNLTAVEISNSVKWIRPYAFYACIHLKSVHIPESVEFVGDHAFGDIDIYYDGSEDSWWRICYPQKEEYRLYAPRMSLHFAKGTASSDEPSKKSEPSQASQISKMQGNPVKNILAVIRSCQREADDIMEQYGITEQSQAVYILEKYGMTKNNTITVQETPTETAVSDTPANHTAMIGMIMLSVTVCGIAAVVVILLRKKKNNQ